MKLDRITVNRLPGISDRFEIDALSEGVNIIVGPNGSGKSSLCRAVRSTLWPAVKRIPAADVETIWRTSSGVELHAHLTQGTRWDRDGIAVDPPTVPADHLARCFTLGLVDLLSSSSDHDDPLVTAIRTQMAGGYDVQKVGERYHLKSGFGGKQDKERQSADQRLKALKQEQAELAGDQDRIPHVEKDLEVARKIAGRLAPIGQALNRLEAQRELTGVEAELAVFPPHLSTLTGDELKQLEALDSELTALRASVGEHSRSLAESLEIQSNCALPDGPLARHELSAWRDRAQRLEQLERDTQQAERSVAAAQGAYSEAAKALGSHSPPDTISLEALEEIDPWCREAFKRHNELDELKQKRQPVPDDEPESTDRLHGGINALRAWLSEAVGQAKLAIILLIIGTLSAVVGGPLAFTVSPWLGALWGLGVGLAAGGIAIWIATGRNSLDVYRQQYADSNLAPPDSWQRNDVRVKLRQLEDDLAALDRERHDYRAKKEANETLESQIASLEAAIADLDEQREAIASAFGIDPAVSDLTLVELAQRIAAFRERATALESARAQLGVVDGQRAEVLAVLGECLRPYVDRTPQDATNALAVLNGLRDRSDDLRRALDDAAAARDALAQAREKIGQDEQRRDELLARTKVDGSHPETAHRQLAVLLDQLEKWRALANTKADLLHDIDRYERDLADQTDLLALDRDELEQLQASAERAKGSVESLNRELGGITDRVQRAKASDQLEVARSAKHEAERAFEECVQEALYCIAGQFLITDVAQQHDEVARPAVLERARNWFAEFTGHRYELLVKTGGDNRGFRARDSQTRAGLSLSELSDGTRSQLLLAARLAFATQEEGADPLPLFLDEALTISDNERFRAVVQAVVRLAEDGRQIFFLTCDSDHVSAWRSAARGLGAAEPRVVDLAAARGQGVAAREPAELASVSMPSIPRPAGATPEAYGVTLGVVLPDPFAAVDGIHLFYLLKHDLELLHRVLAETRLETIGRWRSAAGGQAISSMFSAEERGYLLAAIDVAEAFADVWRVGRGRPVDRQALVESDAVSDRYLDGLAELLQELGGEAETLIAALRSKQDERSKGFHTKNVEKLEVFFEERGHLDRRDPLDAENLRLAVLNRVQPHLRANRITSSQIDGIIRALRVAFSAREVRKQGA